MIYENRAMTVPAAQELVHKSQKHRIYQTVPNSIEISVVLETVAFVGISCFRYHWTSQKH